ncbi:hypothetical protein [Pseudomonas germanica]
MPQERRSYSKSFKAQVIVECAKIDTSIANDVLGACAEKPDTANCLCSGQNDAADANASSPSCYVPN